MLEESSDNKTTKNLNINIMLLKYLNDIKYVYINSQ